MRQQAGVAHHEQHAAIPRGTVIVTLALLSWMAVFSFWHMFGLVVSALNG